MKWTRNSSDVTESCSCHGSCNIRSRLSSFCCPGNGRSNQGWNSDTWESIVSFREGGDRLLGPHFYISSGQRAALRDLIVKIIVNGRQVLRLNWTTALYCRYSHATEFRPHLSLYLLTSTITLSCHPHRKYPNKSRQRPRYVTNRYCWRLISRLHVHSYRLCTAS